MKIGWVIYYLVFFCVSVSAMDYKKEIQEDPCFFKIKDSLKDRNIYVLGSAHVLPLEDSLSPKALDELQKIAKEEKPILLTEHSISNRHALSLLDKMEVQDSPNLEEYKFLLDDKVLVTPKEESNKSIRDLFQYPGWIVAPILSTHYGSLFYPNFGGTEYALENDNKWQKHWSNVQYLEGVDHYDILKNNNNLDKKHNELWIRKTLEKLSYINPILGRSWALKDYDKFKNAEERNDFLVLEKEGCVKSTNSILDNTRKNYLSTGWECIYFEDFEYIPQSAFERNKLWAKNFDLLDDKKSNYLFVVGNGHLAGYTKKVSFLYYLQDLFKEKLERFVNQSSSWEETE